MLPDILNSNNIAIKTELYPESIATGERVLPEGLKSLCNEIGEIQRSINIDSENTFKINHGEVTNDFKVFGKVITNGVITKELTINEKLTINAAALLDFVNRHKMIFANVITDDMIFSKIEDALNKKDESGKTLIEREIETLLADDERLTEIINPLIETEGQKIQNNIINQINIMLGGVTNEMIDEIFNEEPEPPVSDNIAYGMASSSTTIFDDSVIGSYNIVNGSSNTQIAPFGLKFGSTMSSTKNFIEITPIEQIKSGYTLSISVYQTESNDKSIQAKIYIDGNTVTTEQSEKTQKSSETGTKYLTTIDYVFTQNVTEPIRIGFGNSSFRLHEYAITK